MRARAPCMQTLFKKFASQPASSQPARMSVESGQAMFHYLLESGAVFLTLTEKGWVAQHA